MLDPQSQAMLDAITVKEVAALTPEDIGFLRARRFYLNSDQHNRYAEVLADEQPAAPTEEVKTEEAPESEEVAAPAEEPKSKGKGRKA